LDKICSDACNPALQHLDINVAGETCIDGAWRDRDSADAPILVAALELDGKKRISRLRLPIGAPRVISSPLKVQVFQINVAHSMSVG